MKTLLLFLSICFLFIQCSSGNGDDGKPYVFDKQENIDFNSIDYPEIDNPEHMHPVQKEKESQIGSKRFDLNSHSGRYAPIFREK